MSVSQLPGWFVSSKVGEKTVQLDGVAYTIHILSRELAPDLVGFVGREKASGEFFASEDVPDEFFEFIMIHEIKEFTEFAGIAGRCLAAVLCEFDYAKAQLSVDRLKVYLEYRLDFFRRLVEYYRDKDGQEELKYEISHGLTTLESVASLYGIK